MSSIALSWESRSSRNLRRGIGNGCTQFSIVVFCPRSLYNVLEEVATARLERYCLDYVSTSHTMDAVVSANEGRIRILPESRCHTRHDDARSPYQRSQFALEVLYLGRQLLFRGPHLKRENEKYQVGYLGYVLEPT